MYGNKYISGTTSTTFSPKMKLTRGMLVTILHNMEGKPNVSGKSKFPDVQNTNEYYYSAVKWASKNNIVNGYNNGKPSMKSCVGLIHIKSVHILRF